MSRTPTKEQYEAIHASGNVLVNASAGTGKTFVLTSRIANLIREEKADAESLLVITFTKEAAASMLDRTIQAVSQAADECRKNGEHKKADRLADQLQRLPAASIQTIDSFCEDLVKEYLYVQGMEDVPDIIPDYMRASLQNQAFARAYEQVLQTDRADLLNLTGLLSSYPECREQISRLHDQLVTIPDGMNWMHRQIAWNTGHPGQFTEQAAGITLEEAQAAFESRRMETVQALHQIEDLFEEVIGESLDPSGMESALMKAQGELEAFLEKAENGEPVFSSGTYSNLNNLVRYKTGTGTLKFYGADADGLREKMTRAQNLYRNTVQSYIVTCAILNSLEEDIQLVSAQKGQYLVFEKLMKAYHDAFGQVKRENRVVDYADLENQTLEILKANDGQVAKELREKYTHVLVDEYQDVNPLQEELIQLVSREDNLFCVGDMKQSIYRFRHAEPGIFQTRLENYESGVWKGTVLSLTVNFRSEENILDGVNDVFQSAVKTSEEIDYGTENRLRAGRDPEHPVSEEDRQKQHHQAQIQVDIVVGDERFLEIDPDQLTADPRCVYQGNPWMLESMQIVRRIQELKETDPDFRYSRVCVLNRSRRPFHHSLCKVLEANGIPYLLDNTGDLQDCLEIRLLVSILQLALDPGNDYSLMALFHNGFFDLEDDDLLRLREYACHQTEENVPVRESLYQGLARAVHDPALDPDFQNRLLRLWRFIQRLGAQAQILTPAALIQEVVSALDYRDFLISLGDGMQRLENLEQFIRSAKSFSLSGKDRLALFLRGIADTREDVDTSAPVSERDAVRLMTIHGSKGLEFDYVFLPFTGSNENREQRDKMYIHPKYGIFLPYLMEEEEMLVPEKKANRDFYPMSFIQHVKAEEDREENLRLLYVAMTRASRKLFITGTYRKESRMNWRREGQKYAGTNPDLDLLYLLEEEEQKKENEKSVFLSLICQAAYDTDLTCSGDWDRHAVSARDLLDLLYPDLKPAEMEQMEWQKKPELNLRSSDVTPGWTGNFFASQLEQKRFEIPDGYEQQRMKEGAREGDAAHLLLQHCDFRKVQEPGYLETLADQLFLEEDRNMLHFDQIRRMLDSPVGRRIARADQVCPEKKIRYVHSFEDGAHAATGIMDLLFQENGRWYLVDWKTDSFDSTDLTSPLFERSLKKNNASHLRQIELYRDMLKEGGFHIELEDMYLAYTKPGVFWSYKEGRVVQDESQEPDRIAPSENSETMVLRRRGEVIARARISPKGETVLLKGSRIREKTVTSCPASVLADRNRHRDLLENCELLQDIVFPSRSAAAAFVLGYNVNGASQWRPEPEQE